MIGAGRPCAAATWRTVAPVVLRAEVDGGGDVAERGGIGDAIAPLFWTSSTVPDLSTIAAAAPLSPVRVATMRAAVDDRSSRSRRCRSAAPWRVAEDAPPPCGD